MKRPTITAARRLCEEHGARQVIVLCFDGESVAGASYGATREECADVAAVLDVLVDGMLDRSIPVPGAIPPRRGRR